MAGLGNPKTGGRKPGVTNRVTREFRETVRKLLEDNADNFGRWLMLVAEGDGTEIGKPDPGKALDIIAKLAEFAAPKLARTEVVGDPNAPMQTVTRIELVDLSGDGPDSTTS